jgi:flagellar hook-associated protein 3 FlgL
MNERITPTMVSSTVLHNLDAAFAKLNHSSEELSSGKTIAKPSDNPVGTNKALGLQSALEGLSSYGSNVKEAIAWENTATSALSSIGSIVQKLRSLTLEAANGVNNQSNLESIAGEVEQLTESVKMDANARFGDIYIFSGTMTETPPYKEGAEDTYQGNEGQIARAVAPNSSVQIGASASSLLGNGTAAADGKLLDVMRTIAQHMREGTPEAVEELRNTDLKGIETNEHALIAAEAHIGTTTQQLQVAESRIEELRISTLEALSNVQDTNVAQVSIEYSGQQAAYEAALRSGASIVQMSLLEFLK